MMDQAVAEPERPKTETRRLRAIWWIGFVVAPVIGVISMLIIAFVILRLPSPFAK